MHNAIYSSEYKKIYFTNISLILYIIIFTQQYVFNLINHENIWRYVSNARK